MIIFNNVDDFKRRVSNLHKLLQTQMFAINPLETIKHCVFNSQGCPFTEKELTICQRIYEHVNDMNTDRVSLCKLQQIIANACSNMTYQDLKHALEKQWQIKKQWKSTLDLFDIQQPYLSCHSLVEKFAEYDYPEGFKKLTWLAAWEEVWNYNLRSTPEKVFIVPPIPLSVFENDGLHAEKNCRWKIIPRFEQLAHMPTMGLLVYKGKKLIGAMHWELRGKINNIDGVEFFAIIRRDDKVYYIDVGYYLNLNRALVGNINILPWDRKSDSFNMTGKEVLYSADTQIKTLHLSWCAEDFYENDYVPHVLKLGPDYAYMLHR